MKNLRFNVAALALAVCTALPAAASSVVINFDNVAAGSTANSAAPDGVSFFQTMYVNDVNNDGDEIPNTSKWKADTEISAILPIRVQNTLLNAYGSAPSGTNALDARNDPVLMRFSSIQNLNQFSVTLDNSSYGNLVPASLYFLDANSNVLHEVNFDQTILGLIVNLDTPVNGVRDILLSSGAFYDNITFNSDAVAPVPLPAAFPLLLSALSMLGLWGRRRNAK